MIELTEQEWNDLFDKVDDAVQDLISTLPPDLKCKADSIVCFLSRGIDRNILGIAGPSQNMITIYVGNIYAAEKGNLETTLSSARQVYYHELGHHLRLNEAELKERGL